jgi:hypothetical protein
MRPAAAAVAKRLQTCHSLKSFSLDSLILDLTVVCADFSYNAGIPGLCFLLDHPPNFIV